MEVTIMTVDDSPSIRQMVGFTLRNAGFKVLEAEDGQVAVEKLAQTPVNMVITDLNMPNMDGIELIKEVRKSTGYSTIPILMLTTESQAAKKEQAKAAGATGWIVKPFVQEKLLEVVKKVIR